MSACEPLGRACVIKALGSVYLYYLCGKRGWTGFLGLYYPHPGKNHPEEQDEVSCLVSGLTRTYIGHQDAKPEVRCSHGQCSPDSPPP